MSSFAIEAENSSKFSINYKSYKKNCCEFDLIGTPCTDDFNKLAIDSSQSENFELGLSLFSQPRSRHVFAFQSLLNTRTRAKASARKIFDERTNITKTPDSIIGPLTLTMTAVLVSLLAFSPSILANK